ncbi:MAG: exodeoxyribonuclease VII small subunit [Akkermansia sp.]|nr:exodeoxyribonuclease VII small subunit [Akkermansia sp.]
MAKQAKQELSFESAITRLEEIIQLTETPQTELEEMISLVEEGNKLIRHCRNILQKAELRIEELNNPNSKPSQQITDNSTADEFTLS